MDEVRNILVSIDDRHVKKLLDGTKKVELRRRNVNVAPKSKVWIYSKVPVGKVCAVGIVESVFIENPAKIWEEYGTVSGISKKEFHDYFADREEGCAIVFEEILPIENAIPLESLRNNLRKFQPPQFFKYLDEDSPELELFQHAYA